MELTTTEKLLIATAFDYYGSNNILEVNKYLKYNKLNLTTGQIAEIYNQIKKESELGGYSSAVDYCEDKRYMKAVLCYKKYKKLIYDVLEDNVDLNTIVIPEDEPYNVGKQTSLVDIKNKRESHFNDLHSYTENLPKCDLSVTDQTLQIEPKNINKSNIKMKLESPKNIKEKKRFYLKMDEEEKLIDDYFDYLDLKTTEGQKKPENLGKKNKSFEKYPTLFSTVKIDREEIIEDKDLKIIVDYLSSVLGKSEKFASIYSNIESNTMQYTIMSLMLIIQDIIIEESDREILDKCSDLKKKLAIFCDYYKK
ncbi:hypothetical protein P3W45_001381 [Vairimorpha bombi]